MNLSYADFLKLTEDEFDTIYEKWLARQEALSRERWEVARWTAFRVVCPPQPKIKGGKISILDFIQFPWEKETKANEVESTYERFKQLAERWQ